MQNLLDGSLLHGLGTESTLAEESFWGLMVDGSKRGEFCKQGVKQGGWKSVDGGCDRGFLREHDILHAVSDSQCKTLIASVPWSLEDRWTVVSNTHKLDLEYLDCHFLRLLLGAPFERGLVIAPVSSRTA